MPSPKKSTSPGLLPKVKAFLEALGDRYHRALNVIDEALDSESLKDKIWAVDLILKRAPSTEAAVSAEAATKSSKKKRMTAEEIAQLSEPELLARIRSHLPDPLKDEAR